METLTWYYNNPTIRPKVKIKPMTKSEKFFIACSLTLILLGLIAIVVLQLTIDTPKTFGGF